MPTPSLCHRCQHFDAENVQCKGDQENMCWDFRMNVCSYFTLKKQEGCDPESIEYRKAEITRTFDFFSKEKKEG